MTSAYIATVGDASTSAINETVISSSEIIMRGHRIKIGGIDSSCALFLVICGAEHRIIRRLAVNGPYLLVDSTVKVRIVMQYSSGKTVLKETRLIERSGLLMIGNSMPAP